MTEDQKNRIAVTKWVRHYLKLARDARRPDLHEHWLACAISWASR